MAKDIVPELYEAMLNRFNENIEQSRKVQTFLNKLNNGKVDAEDVSMYASDLGDLLGQTIGETLTESVLPDGTLYWNIAERTVIPLLERVQTMVNEAASIVQERLDKTNGIGLKTINPAFPIGRARALIGKAVDESVGVLNEQNNN